MNNKSNSLPYLVCLFFFKLSVGAILLAVSWDVLTLSANPIFNISLVMALSFIPAALARPLFKQCQSLSLAQLLTISLLLAALLMVVETHFILIKSHWVFGVNFILWIFIFMAEVSCEKWYVSLSQGMALVDVRRLSGVSTSVAQVGVILGPVLVAIAKHFDHALIYWIITLALFCAAIVPLTLVLKAKAIQIKPTVKADEERDCSKRGRAAYVFAFALIWPTLVIFNISAPVLAKLQYHTIGVAAMMEVFIGLATALAGFLHPTLTRLCTHKQRLAVVFIGLALSSITIYSLPAKLAVVLLCTFLIGLTFGYLRVELRTFLSRRYSPKVAGEIVVSANSWSAPLVLLYCLGFYFNASMGASKVVMFAFPLSFILVGVVFCWLLLSDVRYQEETNG